jgi:hypothetical protein
MSPNGSRTRPLSVFGGRPGPSCTSGGHGAGRRWHPTQRPSSAASRPSGPHAGVHGRGREQADALPALRQTGWRREVLHELRRSAGNDRVLQVRGKEPGRDAILRRMRNEVRLKLVRADSKCRGRCGFPRGSRPVLWRVWAAASQHPCNARGCVGP